jgi:hypothetical protein
MATRRRRFWTGLLVGLIVLIGVLWVGYWYAAKTLAESAIARATSASAGREKLACTDLNLGGFPLRLDIRCTEGTYSGAGQTVTAGLGGVSASAPLYWPGYVEATLASPFVVNAPALGIALTGSWSAADVNATAGIGGLRGFGASVASLAVDNAGNAPSMPISALAAATASGGIDPNGNSYTFRASATRLKLTRGDGSLFPDIDGEARLTAVDVGTSLGTNPAATLRAWLQQGGIVTIDRLKVSAAGAMVALSGKLSLSATGLLNGTVLVRYNSIEKLAALVETLRPGTRQKYQVAFDGLNAVTVAANTEDGPVRQTTVTFTDGVIWLGIFPLPVDPVPPLRF